MNRSINWPAAGLVLAAGFLENATWPGSTVGLWLGPALLVGLSPVLGLAPLVYWPAALLASLSWLLFQPWTIAWLVPLHFVLVYFAWRRPAPYWLLAAIALPPLFSAAVGPLGWPMALGVVTSIGLQYLFAVQLRHWLQDKITQLRRMAQRQKAAHGVAVAGSVSSQLDKLNDVAVAIGANTDAMYAIYQELELQSRSDPMLNRELPSRALEASKSIHQTKLRLLMQTASLQENLRFLAGRRGATLDEVCHWVAAKLESSAEQLGKRVSCQVESGEDQTVDLDKQLSLAWILQSVCQQEQRNLNANATWISFAGYQANGKLRVVVTMQTSVEQTGGEWPTMRPLQLAQLMGSKEGSTVECKKGVTSDGQIVLTVEMN